MADTHTIFKKWTGRKLASFLGGSPPQTKLHEVCNLVEIDTTRIRGTDNSIFTTGSSNPELGTLLIFYEIARYFRRRNTRIARVQTKKPFECITSVPPTANETDTSIGMGPTTWRSRRRWKIWSRLRSSARSSAGAAKDWKAASAPTREVWRMSLAQATCWAIPGSRDCY